MGSDGEMVSYRYHSINTHWIVPRIVPNSYHQPMDIRTVRRTNFETLIKEAGTIAELSRRTGTSEKYLRHIYNGFISPGAKSPKQVGDETARKLETGMGKPHGWMDISHALELPHSAQRIIEATRHAAAHGNLSDADAELVIAMIERMAQKGRP